MAQVFFTSNLQRHIPCPPGEAAGATVREVLEAVFAANPTARGYILDEQGALRKHMIVFVGRALACGSTTGSCWVSDDQGDHWQGLGEHLPPIYCVRFA